MTDALQHTTTFTYDAASRRVQTIYPDQTTDSVAYDALGRQAQRLTRPAKSPSMAMICWAGSTPLRSS